MFAHLSKLWHAISTGWVLEYPKEGQEPADLFAKKDRRPWGVRDERGENELERCGWFREEARGRRM
jgi:hypothetical protein